MSAWEAAGQSDEWYTPPAVFEALGCDFDLDVAHPKTGKIITPCAAFYWEGGLEHEWWGYVWMNPPFGARNALVPWLKKFFAHGNGIALVPDRTSAPWFWDAFGQADAALFTRKLRFLRPDGSEGRSPSCGTALLASGSRGYAALTRAEQRGFGILALPHRREAV